MKMRWRALQMQNLPQLDSDYKITPEQIESYQRDGHILLRGVCSKAEIETYRVHINAAVEAHAKKQKALSERDTYGKAFLQLANIWTSDDVVKQFVFAARFARITAQLTMSSAMRLYHDQALYKEAGGGLTPLHQDQFYWPLGTSQSITMWMPLVDVTQEMGIMDFADGSHKAGYLGDVPISDRSEDYFKDYIEEKGFTISQHAEMQAGDATFHNGWTLHGAPGNQSHRMREVMTIIYYPDGTRLIKPENSYQQADSDALYPGMAIGDPAANSLTPVLYSKK